MEKEEKIYRKDWSLQYIFDIVVDHLRIQNKQSIGVRTTSIGNGCLYRSPDGCKCAAGFLIPDDEYLPSFEEKEIHVVSWFRENFSPTQKLLIRNLQIIHDDYAPYYWENEWYKLAISYNLIYAPRNDGK